MMNARIFGGVLARALAVGCAVFLGVVVQGREAVVVEMATQPGKMRFDVELFEAKPGAKVRLVFRNNDEMQHNLLMLKPKTKLLVVAQRAWMLGAEAVKRQYVPEMPGILFHSKVLDPKQEETIEFTVPEEEGDYPYVCTLPGHAYTMKGIMRVRGGGAGVTGLNYAYFEGSWSKLPEFDRLPPKKTGVVGSQRFDIGVAERRDNFGLVFDGVLEVPKAGRYEFFLNSDDGSRLRINGATVVEYDGVHGMGEEKRGTVDLEAGRHRVRVDYFEAAGGEELMVAWAGPGFERTLLTPERAASGGDGPMAQHLHVMDKALVVRVFLENGPARAISVGLPGGVNYCFDADGCWVPFGWFGMFLDVGPDRGGGVDRGGQWCKTLGPRFKTGQTGFPFSFGSKGGKLSPKFLGYDRRGTPTLRYEAAGVKISQTVSAAKEGVGLGSRYQLEGAREKVYFRLDRTGLKAAASAGVWDGEYLVLTPEEARDFTVTVSHDSVE